MPTAPTPIPNITTPVPVSSDPANFEARADLAWTELPVAIAAINVENEKVYDNAVEAETAAETATAKAEEATAAAASAFAAPGTSGTSVTPATIGAGAKTLTIQANKDLVGGMWVLAADAAAPSTNSMAGQIDSYDDVSGVLSFTVPADLVIGSGSFSAWIVSLTGPPANAAALAALTKRCTALALIF